MHGAIPDDGSDRGGEGGGAICKVKLDRYIDPGTHSNSKSMAQLPMSSISISLEFLAPPLPSSAPQNYTGAALGFYA